MFFADLQRSLVDNLRSKVRNGELTERRLAKLVGISQPHMHNVLKGARTLSPDLADQILRQLRLSALDLIDKGHLAQYVQAQEQDPRSTSYLPVLKGRLGPELPWPAEIERYERVPVSAAKLAAMTEPVVVRLADDRQMYPLFGDGDIAVLDQGHTARTRLDPSSLYVVKRGSGGALRRLKLLGQHIYSFAEGNRDQPSEWQQLNLQGSTLQHYVRAKATLISPEHNWRV